MSSNVPWSSSGFYTTPSGFTKPHHIIFITENWPKRIWIYTMEVSVNTKWIHDIQLLTTVNKTCFPPKTVHICYFYSTDISWIQRFITGNPVHRYSHSPQMFVESCIKIRILNFTFTSVILNHPSSSQCVRNDLFFCTVPPNRFYSWAAANWCIRTCPDMDFCSY